MTASASTLRHPRARTGGASAWALAAWNEAAGRVLYRYRNTLFPTVILVVVLFVRPRILFGHPAIDLALTVIGTLVALTGEVVRLVTIGYDYIDRGGRNKQAYASRLVVGGVFAHVRNPMYLGNLLIAIGVGMIVGAPIMYLVVIPFFLFVYQAIVASEEAYLRPRFGRDYDRYCSLVPRFIPALRGIRRTFAGMPYQWKRALRQDLSTITALLLGLACLPLWRLYFLHGFNAAKAAAPATALQALGAVSFFVVVLALKKSKRLG